MTPSRQVILASFGVIKSSFLSKSPLAPTLGQQAAYIFGSLKKQVLFFYRFCSSRSSNWQRGCIRLKMFFFTKELKYSGDLNYRIIPIFKQSKGVRQPNDPLFKPQSECRKSNPVFRSFLLPFQLKDQHSRQKVCYLDSCHFCTYFRESLFNYDCTNVRIVFDLLALRFQQRIYFCT